MDKREIAAAVEDVFEDFSVAIKDVGNDVVESSGDVQDESEYEIVSDELEAAINKLQTQVVNYLVEVAKAKGTPKLGD